jgi:hypothetical protein
MLGEAGSHERRRLFVPDADILDAVSPLAQRLDDRIDAVADDAEGVGRAP